MPWERVVVVVVVVVVMGAEIVRVFVSVFVFDFRVSDVRGCYATVDYVVGDHGRPRESH